MIGALRLGQSVIPAKANEGRSSHHLAEKGRPNEAGDERLTQEEPRGLGGRRPSSEDEVDREKTIEDLEWRRGGSPPAPRRNRSFDDSPRIKERSSTVQDTYGRRRVDDRRDDVDYDDEDDDALSGSEGLVDRAMRKGDETMRRGKDLVEEVQDTVFLSENREGWGMYVSMVAVVALALVLGMIG